MNRISLMVILLLNISLALPVFAAGYLKFDGIEGEAIDHAHKGWIEVSSVTQVVSPRDAASGMPTGKRQHKPIVITKPIDKATPLLAKSLKSGTPLTNVSVDIDGQVIEMKSAMVTSIAQDASGNEVVTLAPVSSAIGAGVSSRPLKATKDGAETSKGNVETRWKVEEGTK